MAETEKIIIEVDLDQGDAQKEVNALSKSIVGLETSNKSLRQDLKKSDTQLKAEGKTRGQLSATIATNQQQLSGLKKERIQNIKVVKSSVNSIESLRLKNSQLTKERDKLNLSTATGRKRFNDLNKEIKANTNTLKQGEEAGGDFRRSVGNYGSALQAVPGPLGAVVNATRSFTVAALAFIATPIGAVIAAIGLALGALTTFFKSSEEGQNALTKVTKIFGVIIGNITDIISDFGKIIFEAISNPKQLVIDLGNLIKENIINRFKAFAVIGKAVIKILEGDFKEGIKDLGDGVIQLSIGIDNFTDRAVNGFNAAKNGLEGLIEETNREIGIAQRLADLQAQIDRDTRKQIVDRARLERDTANLRLKAREEDRFSAEERRAFLAEAIQLQEEQLDADLALAKSKLFLRQEENKLSLSTKEDLEEEARLRADVFSAERTSLETRKRLTLEQQTLDNQIKANDKKNADAAKKEDDEQVKRIQERIDREEEAITKLKEIRLQDAIKQEEDAIKREQLEIELAESDFERKKEEKKLLDEELELLEFEHKARLTEIDSEFRDLEAQRTQEAIDGTKAALDDILASAGEFTDSRIGLVNSLGKFTIDTQNEITENGKISLQTLANLTQIFTDFTKAKNDEQLSNLQEEKAAALALVGSNTEQREAIERNFAQKEAELLKRQFKQEKRLALISASINIALGFTKALASSPPPFNIILAGITAAAGALQIGLISSQQPPAITSGNVFAKGGELPFGGSKIGGNLHNSGGTKFVGSDGTRFEAERGEGIFVLNRGATGSISGLSNLNTSHGGRSFFSGKTSFAQEGGQIDDGSPTAQEIATATAVALSNITIVTKVIDVNDAQAREGETINNGVI